MNLAVNIFRKFRNSPETFRDIFRVMQLSGTFIENLLPIARGSGGGGAVESFVADLAADKSRRAPTVRVFENF